MWSNTLLQCVVWWIASWADDEQYKEEQPREGLFLAGAMNYLGEFTCSFYWFPGDDAVLGSMVTSVLPSCWSWSCYTDMETFA